MKALIIFVCVFVAQLTWAQENFITQLEGTWTGDLEIYAQGKPTAEQPKVTFTVAPLNKDSWTWRTDYDSKKFGVMTKDYVLKTKDAGTGHYILDEKNGSFIDYQLSGNKMHCMFEINDFVLAGTYELTRGQLIFEIYSSPKSKDTTEVVSHRVRNVQRVVLSRKQ